MSSTIEPTTARTFQEERTARKRMQPESVQRSPVRCLELLCRVEQTVMPVWPLRDYVAVNPWAGLAHHDFLEARRRLRQVSACEMLQPVSHYRTEYQQGGFSDADVREALQEWRGREQDVATEGLEERVWRALQGEASPPLSVAEEVSPRRLLNLAELADKVADWSWTDWIRGELTRFCSNYFDEGQAVWSGTGRAESLWLAWKRQARHDRNPQIWGIGSVRTLAAELPGDEVEAVARLLAELEVPDVWQEAYLNCLVLSLPGWFAWARRIGGWSGTQAECNRVFAGLLATRLVYELALAKHLRLEVDWEGLAEYQNSPLAREVEDRELAEVRAVLLRASELSFRRMLLTDLNRQTPVGSAERDRPSAQLVFCIDVRSERFRRNLEALAPTVQTMGFAGFFGMPLEYRQFGCQPEARGDAQLPVLLQPQLVVQEELHETSEQAAGLALSRRQETRVWRSVWKRFQTSLASCFPCVETTGWLSGWRMLLRAFAAESSAGELVKYEGLREGQRELLGPSLRGLNAQGWSTTRLVDLAESMLRNLGLVENFARLVVLCGHRSETANNPLQASLDCGACGGHSGEANSRFAALLLNQEFVRRDLAGRGILIPADTWFLAAVHQTTSDVLEFPDLDAVPLSHGKDVTQLREHCRRAGDLVARERGEVQELGTLEAIRRKCSDWSEVRPEWGLAGNAAFVAGPRDLTRGLNLNGRVFLHDYDHLRDERGNVLELILTAPLIVASWINLQYYASAVDPKSYGSGCKTIHNVVGKFGTLAGAASDLQIGLAWQSVAVGEQLRHSPLRLQAVVAAPRERIEKIVNGHQHLRELLTGGWIHLCALDDQGCWQWLAGGEWKRISKAGNQNA